MRKARNRYERSRQVLAWLEAEWPAGRKVELIWVDEIKDQDERTGKPYHCHGQTYREGRHLVIELSRKKCRTWEGTTETLIHEWCHAVQWGPAALEEKTEHHPAWFYTLYGEIMNRWDHDHGWEQANEYPF